MLIMPSPATSSTGSRSSRCACALEASSPRSWPRISRRSTRHDPLGRSHGARLGVRRQKVRADFPILSERVHGKPLVYLDSADTSQKPQAVLDAMDAYYRHANANIHRGAHLLSERATALYEGARAKARGVPQRARRAGRSSSPRARPTGINLVAQSYGRRRSGRRRDRHLRHGAPLEHRAVADALRADRRGAARRADRRPAARSSMDAYAALLSPRTRIVAMGHVSNALGTINPVREIVEQAHARGAAVLDRRRAGGAASARSTCRRSTATSTSFSSHKMFGPTGDRRALRHGDRCSRRCRPTRAAAT